VNRYCLMTLPFHSQLLRGELTVEEFCARCADVGLGHLEPATSLFTGRDFDPENLLRTTQQHGLALSAYDALADLGQPPGAGRDEALASLRRDLERCRAMGIDRVMVAGARLHDGLTHTRSRQLVAEGMDALVEEADAAGQTLLLESFGVEPHFHASSEHLAEVLYYADPRLRITFDMGNHLLGGDVPVDVVDRWADHTAHVHVKEFRYLGQGEPGGLLSRDGKRCGYVRLDQGDVHAGAVIHRFEAAGYQGLYSLEMCGGDSFETIAADLAVVEQALANG